MGFPLGLMVSNKITQSTVQPDLRRCPVPGPEQGLAPNLTKTCFTVTLLHCAAALGGERPTFSQCVTVTVEL
jgi:hypothetical protein